MRNGKRRVLGSLLALTMVMVAGHGVSANGRDDSGPVRQSARRRPHGRRTPRQFQGRRVQRAERIRYRAVGIDYRVQDGKLYGVGDAGGVYTLDKQRQGDEGEPSSPSPCRVSYFGVDFDPVADRLRS